MQPQIIILGSGTSMGVPTLGCNCIVCTSTEPRNTRTRPSISIEWSGTHAQPHRVLIDTGPDFRQQALREHIQHIDAVFYTHSHADHILGLDDLRPLSFRHPHGMPLYADDRSSAIIESVFEYTFSPHAKYPTRARVNLNRLNGHETVDVGGLNFQRVPLLHGDLPVAGYRFGPAAYLTDMSSIPDTSLPLLEDLDILILDALRWEPHPSHSNIEQALAWIDRVQPRSAYFTHMSHEIDHVPTEAKLPPTVRLAYDGLRIPFALPEAGK